MTAVSSPPTVGVEGARYVHDQASPQEVWVVVHALGAIPSAVSIIDSANTQVFGEVRHIDTNTTHCIFSAPFSGKAYVIG